MINLEKLQAILTNVVIIGACCVYLALIFVLMFEHYDGRYYNCTMSETSDFPPEVKEKCRNHKSGRV